MYEIGTNKPIYTYRIGTNINNGGYYQTYTLGENGATGVMPVDIAALKKEYERVNALTPEAARAEYDKSRSAEKIPRVKPEEIEEIIKSMNVSGAWIEDVVIRNYDNPQLPARYIRGIETSTYINNMKKMIYYLKNLKQKD